MFLLNDISQFSDGVIWLQLGWPDMRLPILYTLSWPRRINTSEQTWPRLDFVKMGNLTFMEPDRQKYPALDLSFAAGRTGGTMTGVLSAANEKVRTVIRVALICGCFILIVLLSIEDIHTLWPAR